MKRNPGLGWEVLKIESKQVRFVGLSQRLRMRFPLKYLVAVMAVGFLLWEPSPTRKNTLWAQDEIPT
jgi:hypothetical protein